MTLNGYPYKKYRCWAGKHDATAYISPYESVGDLGKLIPVHGGWMWCRVVVAVGTVGDSYISLGWSIEEALCQCHE